MIAVYIFLIILIITCGLGIWYIVLFNNLQHCNNKIDQAESIIDETLRNRYDLVIQAIESVKKIIPEKKKLFNDIQKLKEENISNFDLDRKLTEFIILIRQLKSDYKELANNKDFKETISKLKETDEKLHAAKSFYNKYTSLSNELIRKFPSNIIAKMHKMKIKLFFDGKDMHDDIVDDFKF